MGALPVDHLLVMRDQGVQLLGQGLQLGGIAARHPLGAALAHLHDLSAQVEQRLQTDPHLQDHRRDQKPAGDHQQGGRADGEVAHVAVHRRAVFGGQEHHRGLALRQAPGQGDHPQRLALRPLGVVVHGRADGQAREVGGSWDLAVPERARDRQGKSVQPPAGHFRQLPVLAGIDPSLAGVAELGWIHLPLVHRGPRVEALGDVPEAGIEAAQRGGGEDEGQRRQGHGQHHQAPGRGQPDQPPDQRGAAGPTPQRGVQGPHASAGSPCSGLSR